MLQFVLWTVPLLMSLQSAPLPPAGPPPFGEFADRDGYGGFVPKSSDYFVTALINGTEEEVAAAQVRHM